MPSRGVSATPSQRDGRTTRSAARYQGAGSGTAPGEAHRRGRVRTQLLGVASTLLRLADTDDLVRPVRGSAPSCAPAGRRCHQPARRTRRAAGTRWGSGRAGPVGRPALPRRSGRAPPAGVSAPRAGRGAALPEAAAGPARAPPATGGRRPPSARTASASTPPPGHATAARRPARTWSVTRSATTRAMPPSTGCTVCSAAGRRPCVSDCGGTRRSPLAYWLGWGKGIHRVSGHGTRETAAEGSTQPPLNSYPEVACSR